jgi:hypothetical protein
MIRSIPEKMGIKKKAAAIFINAPVNFEKQFTSFELNISDKLTGEFDYIHCFVKTQKDFHSRFPILKKHLKPTGVLWLSWPKSGQLQTDLSLTKVIEIGYEYGLVESKVISLDEIWSVIKFTHPKVGKQYNNSYGKLKS